MKALALINEIAGSVIKIGPEELVAMVEEELAEAGWTADVIVGEAPALIEAAREAKGYDAAICAGGDGTQAAAADALLERDMALLPLPCGTMNVLCRDLGLPMNIREALQEGLKARPARIDVGLVWANGGPRRVFLNNIVFGAYASLAEAREYLREVETLDDLSFAAVHAASALANAKPANFRIDLDGDKRLFRTNTLIVANNAYTGSSELVPMRDCLDKGSLAVYLAESEGGASFTARLLEFLRGDPEMSGKVEMSACGKCTVAAPDGPAPYAVDGDPEKPVEHAVMEIAPRALTVLAPAFDG